MNSPKPGPSKISSDEDSYDLILKDSLEIIIKETDDENTEFVDKINYDSDSNDLIFEETDQESDVEFDEVFKNPDDLNEWTCNGEFKKIPFNENTGFYKDTTGMDAFNFFEILFDDNFFTEIVTEMNKYAENKHGNNWKSLTLSEFRKFFGILLHMGTIKCPKIENYWSTHRLFSFNCFSQHMSRNRFQNILCSLHVDCSDKILPIVNYFNNKMKEIYNPHKELVIEDLKLQLMAGKLYILTESSGITLRVNIFTGNDSQTSIILNLLEDFLQKGYSVFIDEFFTNFTLTNHLLNSKTYCTGPLRKLRKGNNLEVIKTKLLKGEIISRYKNNIMIGKYRNQMFISSEYKADLVKFDTKRKEQLKKPVALLKYKKFTSGIDKKNQILSMYTCSRCTFKWFIKLWIHLVEILLLNSFFLYSKYTSTQMKLNFYDYRLNIIDILLFDHYQDNVTVYVPQLEHLPEMLTRRYNNKIKRKRCRQCTATGKRKETNYFCTGCKDNPGLCIGKCFRDYHKRI